MFILEIFILVLLLSIFIQDICSYSVLWIFFPLLFCSLVLLSANRLDKMIVVTNIILNLVFIIVQFALVTIYFYIKTKKWLNITTELIGWGDILFLMCITPAFSFPNYLFFYIFSLFVSLILTISLLRTRNKNINKIPLAGFQSLILGICLWICWHHRINLANNMLFQFF